MRLRSTVFGRGPRGVVFLHGFTGGGASFSHLEPVLGDEVRARCLVLPGHEDAAPPAARGEAGFREAVAAIAEELGEGATLVGYSQGARLALAVAALHPAKVGALVLEGVHPGLADAQERQSRRDEDEARARALETEGLEAFLAQWEQHPVLAGQRGLRPELSATLAAQRRRHSAQGLAGALRSLGLAAQPALPLELVRGPVLLLSGAEDAKFTALAQHLALQLRGARHVAIAGAGHSPHLEAPEAYARAVRDFLR